MFEEEVVGGLLGDVGPVGFEEFEVGVDGGVGDAESRSAIWRSDWPAWRSS